MDRREEIIDWLNDAYGMERALEVTLEKQTNSTEVHPAVRERAAVHLDETRTHADRVEQALQKLGSTPSTVKTAVGQVLETGKKYITMFAKDERVKDYLAAVGSEHFEVACYRALIAAARAAGKEEIVPLLQQNLDEDAATARWMEENIEGVIRDYFNQDRSRPAMSPA